MTGQPRKSATKPAKTLEQRLWDTADALRGNQEPSECKHIAGIVNNPEGFVNVDYNRYNIKLPWETLIKNMALLSRATGGTVSVARRQP